MKRAETLINKLQEQLVRGENAKQLLATAQLLVAELNTVEQPDSYGRVSVWMPEVYFSGRANETVQEVMPVENETAPIIQEDVVEEIVAEIKQVETVQSENAEVATIVATEQQEIVQEIPEIVLVAEEKEQMPEGIGTTRRELLTAKPVEEIILNSVAEEPVNYMEIVFASTAKTETPVIQMSQPDKQVFELNDVMTDTVQSFNDKLKIENKEVAAKLTETPIKDLRKGIGINDRYRFINQLFQGDENMYERSIKTINNFGVFPEAEQWIRRELHTKLCWIDTDSTVQQFDHLIRRRFA